MQELYDLDKYFFDNRGKLIFAKRIDGTEVRRLTAGNPAEIDVFRVCFASLRELCTFCR
jgi:hypothetical protein